MQTNDSSSLESTPDKLQSEQPTVSNDSAAPAPASRPPLFSLYKDKLHVIFACIFLAASIGFSIAACVSSGFQWQLFLLLGMGILAAAVTMLQINRPKLVFALKIPVAVLAPAIIFILMESYTHSILETMEWDAIALNLVFFYLLYFFLICLTGRTTIALIIEIILCMLIGAINYFVIEFRSSPIVPWDLASLKTAMSVADNYQFTITYPFACLVTGAVLLISCSAKASFRIRKLLVRAIAFAVLLIPSYFYISFLYQPDLSDTTSLDNTLFTPKFMFKTNGFFVAFIMDTRYLRISPPDGYSASNVKSMLDQYEEEQPEITVSSDELPNIIVVMNECFSDPSVIADFDTNIDYMPFVHSLLQGADNAITGHLYVSVLGGNTANSEFEFLTGNTMAFLPQGSVAYQQYIQGQISSVVSEMNAFGYDTTAMHPYNSTGWNRNVVYDYMQFDQMLFINDFVNKVKVRKYTDDASDYENVLRVLNSKETPQFIFNVTMQNHSGFGVSNKETDNYNFNPEVSATLSNTKSNTYLNRYLSLMKVSDEAIEGLLNNLEKTDKKTIVVFFGDHQPNDYVVEPVYKENSMDIDNQTLEEHENRQIVPFFIWANYDIPEQSNVSISLNYLSSLLFETAGLPLSGYQAYLSDLRTTIPILNAVGYAGTDGIFHSFSDADGTMKEKLEEYEGVQYYELLEKNK